MPITGKVSAKSFFESRLEFTEINKESNREKKKPSVRCHSALTAFFLQLFGKSPVKLKVHLHGKQTSIFVNRSSLKKWLKEHHQDLKGASKWKSSDWQTRIEKCIKEIKDSISLPIPERESEERVSPPMLKTKQSVKTKTLETAAAKNKNNTHVKKLALSPSEKIDTVIQKKPLSTSSSVVKQVQTKLPAKGTIAVTYIDQDRQRDLGNFAIDYSSKGEKLIKAIAEKVALEPTEFVVLAEQEQITPESDLEDFRGLDSLKVLRRTVLMGA